jgi:L-iditol 2-dehydrogenase
MITDINQKRLDLAKKCGIDRAVNIGDISLRKAIDEYFGEQQADVIVDCAAVKSSISQIIENARSASTIVIVGNFKEPVEIELPMLQRREVDMLDIMMYLREDFQRAINLISEKKIKLDGLISDYYDIRAFTQSYADIDSHPNDVMKVMMKFKD